MEEADSSAAIAKDGVETDGTAADVIGSGSICSSTWAWKKM